MSLDIQQLCERVAAKAWFSDVEQIDNTIVRSVRKSGGKPFAVFYFDITQELPNTQESLSIYQDRVIGRFYFDGDKSLQWNNYLYFITSSEYLANDNIRKAKELIERDRTYARKFVISEEFLDSTLTPSTAEPSGMGPQASILSTWTDLLVKAGIDRAILGEYDLPARLKLIESSSSEPAKAFVATKRSSTVNAEPFINSLRILNYRAFPHRRDYNFGRVNLIFGTNGSGKTSLLEAIELMYCGKNKRNPHDNIPYELISELADGRTDRATNNRPLQLFRDRNLAWYGQSEINTSYVYQSFAQYNFLDTDAAVSLAESTSRIEEDLSKLLVGPDASKIWKTIARTDDAVISSLKDLRQLEKQIQEELFALNRLLKDASTATQESDSLYMRLGEMIARAGWIISNKDKDALAGYISETLPELSSLAEQATSIDWAESPVSIYAINSFCRNTMKTEENAASRIDRLDELRKNEKHLADAIKRSNEIVENLREAKRFIDADIPLRSAERSKLHISASTLTSWLADCDEKAMEMLAQTETDAPIAKYYSATMSKHSAAYEMLLKAKSDQNSFSIMRDQSLNLAQHLREIAAQILLTASNPDECPLCHTQFNPNELAQHINMGVDEHLEELGQKLLTQLREKETDYRKASEVLAAIDWLRKFCDRAVLADNISLYSALSEFQNTKRELSEARVRIETLDRELLGYESQGLSLTKWEALQGRLFELEIPPVNLSKESLPQLLKVVSQEFESSTQTLESERKQAAELQKSLETALDLDGASMLGVKRALSQLKERRARAEGLRDKLLVYSSSFPWPAKRPLTELVIEATAIRKVAAELQSALGREKQAKTAYNESIKRKEHLDNQLPKLSQRISRLKAARNTLKTIRTEYSLAGAMESALKQNRAGIEAIFARIHSPADFSGLGKSLTTIIRKDHGNEVKLSQISTGQRAALALSIFLAQNAQLTVAPPVMLIDDPIAHIDDLNSLSFLDYLREVVVTGRRQVFFATANEKLASLFERKFDFLSNNGFVKIHLRRDATII